MLDLIDSFLCDWSPLITTPWIVMATVILYARKYQGLLTRLFFILLLACWYLFLALPDHSRLFTELLTELMRWKDSKNLLGRHYTLNIVEMVITQAITEFMILAFPDCVWTTSIAIFLVVAIFYRFNVAQLWMQKQLSRLGCWNREIWQSGGLFVESAFAAIGTYAETPATRAVVQELCWQWYRFTIRVPTLLDACTMASCILYFMDGSNSFRRVLHQLFNMLIIHHLFFGNLGKFANPKPPKHEYIPLRNPRDIRVILLYPRFAFLPICCSLLQGSQMSLLTYEAISYTWGDMGPTENILVDGCKMKVTRSVYEVLATYSSLFVPKLLWIDAVCIDQGNEVEKTNQVQLMGKIYGNALFGTVFLGRAPLMREAAQRHTPPALRFGYGGLKRIDNITRLHFEDAHLAFDLLNELEVLDGVLEGSMSNIYETYEMLSKTKSKGWTALLSMLRHPWFERIWVVQEVALTERVQVRYGDEVIDWDILAKGIDKLQLSRLFPVWLEWRHRIGLRQVEHTSLYNITRIHRLRHKVQAKRYQNDKRGVTLSKVLAKSFYFKASNPRDLIYGLLGISCDQVSVDYGASVEEVYFNAAKEMCEQGAIHLLFHSAGVGNRLGTNPSTSRLPSWVPDWTNAPRYARLKDFKAGGKVENKANRTMGRILTLSGFYVDSVDEVGSILRSATDREGEWTVDEMRQLAIGYEKCWTQIKDSPLSRDPYPHVAETQSLREAFHRTMVVNKLWVERWNKSSTELLDLFPKWEEDLKYFLLDRSTLDPVEGDALYRRLQRMDRVTERIKASWSGRLTVITQNGYIGLCPPYTQQGDLIAVARGLDVPVVLRRIYKDEKQSHSCNVSTQKYRLVGQCYAHGLMNGEALSMGTAEEEIEII